MSQPIHPLTNSLNIKTIQTIDQFNLPIIKKHHLRILAHCLIISKSIIEENSNLSQEDLLRKWCNNQSQKFNDQKFNDLLYDQLLSTSKKLNNLSRKLGKSITDLEIEDLLTLIQ